MVDANEWQGRTGDSWAAEWRRTDRSFGALTEHLLKRTREFRFHTALDIGCGAGELSLALARGRPHVKVIGVDISEALTAIARERGANLANVSFQTADAARWQPGEGAAPDLLISRHGVMFFDDPVAAFGHLTSVSAQRATLLFSCFRERSQNPFFNEVARLLPQPPPETAADEPGPFAFADKDRVERILREGGWRDIAFEPFDFAMIAGGGTDPVADAVDYFMHIGPAARAAAQLSTDERERFGRRLTELARRNQFDGGLVSLRAATWIVSARRP